MESSQANNPVAEFLKTPRGRWQVVVVCALVMMAVAIWINVPRTVETCELVHGLKLKKHDLQRIQVALSQAGLNDFEITDHNICVPKQHRNLYLKAITEADVLPEELAPRQEDSLNLNPFLSRSQQEQVQLTEKKKQIRELVMRLPFVEEAWFEMDRTKSRSSFQQDEHSAVILIQPTDELRLENSQVETIRGLITGAIAGIEKKTIVVTDLNAGVAFQESSSTGNVDATNHPRMSVQAASTRTPGRQAYFENEVRKVLADYKDLKIVVQVVDSETEVEVPNLQAMTSSHSQVIQVGTNGQASVPKHLPKKTVKESRLVEKVKAQIGIPESLILDGIVVDDGLTLESRRISQAYRTALIEIKSDITSRLRKVLPEASFATLDQSAVQIEVIEQENQIAAAPAAPWFEQALTKVGGVWGGLAVLLGALMIVAFVFSGTRQVEEQEVAALMDSNEVADTEANPSNEQSIKQEISKLIKEDPEAAAQVIKRWIRNAA